MPARQFVQDDASAMLVVPAPQSKQFEEDSKALYLPAVQDEHSACPSPLYLPIGQLAQVDNPVELDILPLAHARQIDAP